MALTDAPLIISLAVTLCIFLLLWAAFRGAEEGSGATRANFRGKRVVVCGGPLIAVAGSIGVAILIRSGELPPSRVWVLLGILLCMTAGLIDDFFGEKRTKGLRGHIRALILDGRVTTGLVKILLIGGAAVVVLIPIDEGYSLFGLVLDLLLVTALAGLANLLDTRPGRCLKGVGLLLLVSAPLGSSGVLADLSPLVLAATAFLLLDLGEKAMLGDSGSNTVGFMAGVTLAMSQSLLVRGLLAAAALILNLVSERVSFTGIIERDPVLRWLDRLGRGE